MSYLSKYSKTESRYNKKKKKRISVLVYIIIFSKIKSNYNTFKTYITLFYVVYKIFEHVLFLFKNKSELITVPKISLSYLRFINVYIHTAINLGVF